MGRSFILHRRRGKPSQGRFTGVAADDNRLLQKHLLHHQRYHVDTIFIDPERFALGECRPLFLIAGHHPQLAFKPATLLKRPLAAFTAPRKTPFHLAGHHRLPTVPPEPQPNLHR